jgi:glycerol-3-phosphate dehydrogenase
MKREAMLDRVRGGETWDLVVIGGGATGLGTAVDAAARGYRTLLLEAHDFAKATSSRSTKLIHGGVRYLAQGHLHLVREALHERERLRRNAPHLVHDLSFLVPAYSWWMKPYYGLGLRLYDGLAGSRGLGASRSVARTEALRLVPTLEPSGLRGGIVYTDGQFDDARLAIALLRTLTDDLGGTALNYAPVTALRKSAGKIEGVEARDAETGETFAIAARGVINATGIFADEVRRLDEPEAPAMLATSQGAHLVLDRSFLPGDCALLIPRTDDGRVLFVIPWHGRALVGTTDVPVARPEIEPRPLAEEIAYLLSGAARYLTRDPRPADVLSTFAGLRPLVAPPSARERRTAKISRDYAVAVSGSGLITIAGGKWTTYRRMGAAAVDRAAVVAGLSRRPSATESLALHGASEPASDGRFASYGSDAPTLTRLIAERADWSAPIHPPLPYLAGEIIWAARHEGARTVEDVLARRTRALILDARSARAAAPLVASILADELGRDPAWQAEQVRRFEELAGHYLLESSESLIGRSRSS